MTTSPRQHQSGYYLHTLGSLALRGADSAAIGTLRKKDLALLTYLCVEGQRAHSRVFLSSMLWGDHPQARARHSLTQAVSRLRSVLGDALVSRSEQIEWRGPLGCDACALERAHLGEAAAREQFRYEGDFLVEFRPGGGAQEFESWAEQRRMRYRAMVLQVLDSCGAQAEARGQWAEALEFGRRAVEIEPLYQEGHRRAMRAWTALGERGLALRHYSELVLWLRTEVELQPDPATSQLAMELRRDVEPGPQDRRPIVDTPKGSHGSPDSKAGRLTAADTNDTHGSEVVGDPPADRRMWGRLIRAVQHHATRWRAARHGRRLQSDRIVILLVNLLWL